MPNRGPSLKSVSRRHFSKWCGSNLAIGAAVIGGAALPHSVRSASTAAPSERLNIACIGVGGRGAANISGVQEENVVALCDVDERRAAKSFEKYESARRFSDFRRMFDEMDRDIDAVVISTPDHTHFHPAWWAIERGKHIYLEKPLAHEIVEVRRLTEAARVKNVATQLGCQRHALTGLRAGVELVRSGMIGEIREVHSWVKSGRGMPAVPGRTDAPPQAWRGISGWGQRLSGHTPVVLRPMTGGFGGSLARVKPATGAVTSSTYRFGPSNWDGQYTSQLAVPNLISTARRKLCRVGLILRRARLRQGPSFRRSVSTGIRGFLECSVRRASIRNWPTSTTRSLSDPRDCCCAGSGLGSSCRPEYLPMFQSPRELSTHRRGSTGSG